MWYIAWAGVGQVLSGPLMPFKPLSVGLAGALLPPPGLSPAHDDAPRQGSQQPGKHFSKTLSGRAHGGVCKVPECLPVPKPRPHDHP